MHREDPTAMHLLYVDFKQGGDECGVQLLPGAVEAFWISVGSTGDARLPRGHCQHKHNRDHYISSTEKIRLREKCKAKTHKKRNVRVWSLTVVQVLAQNFRLFLNLGPVFPLSIRIGCTFCTRPTLVSF